MSPVVASATCSTYRIRHRTTTRRGRHYGDEDRALAALRAPRRDAIAHVALPRRRRRGRHGRPRRRGRARPRLDAVLVSRGPTSPPPLLQRETLQHIWRTRAEWTPRAAGTCPWRWSSTATSSGSRRCWRTSSPCSERSAPGRGSGVATREKASARRCGAAILHLAFAGLGAEYALSRRVHRQRRVDRRHAPARLRGGRTRARRATRRAGVDDRLPPAAHALGATATRRHRHRRPRRVPRAVRRE